MAARYAIYYTPPAGSALDAFARHWLGRDVFTGETVAQPVVPGLSASRLAELTAPPRGYGFHGTLKPPLRLAEGRTEAELDNSLEAFAQSHDAFETSPLALAEIGRFIALVPASACPRLDELAADAVRAFDPFRRPADDAELARRRGTGLTARQNVLLQRWGYPFVMEEFRFHLTLSGSVADAAERARIFSHLAVLTRHLVGVPLRIDAVALCTQAEEGGEFRIRRRVPLRTVSTRDPCRAEEPGAAD